MAYIYKEDVAAIRAELKAEFPKWKFSVRKGSGSLSVDVAIQEGTAKFERKPNVENQWMENIWKDESDKQAFDQIKEIMHNAPGRADSSRKYFDHSDSQSDYFHTAFYTHLNIGAWNKPYVRVTA